ncbi:hypothetical protein Pfo_009343, partial [Paulownia fortunei]
MRPPAPPHAPPSTEATTTSGPPPRPTTHSPTPLPNFNTKHNLRLSASSSAVGGAASSLLRLDTVPSASFPAPASALSFTASIPSSPSASVETSSRRLVLHSGILSISFGLPFIKCPDPPSNISF